MRWAVRPTTEDMARAGEQPRGERPEQSDVAESEAARAEVRAISAPGAAAPGEATPLFEADEAERFRLHWGEIQAGFVDEPRRTVEQADKLVAQITSWVTIAPLSPRWSSRAGCARPSLHFAERPLGIGASGF